MQTRLYGVQRDLYVTNITVKMFSPSPTHYPSKPIYVFHLRYNMKYNYAFFPDLFAVSDMPAYGNVEKVRLATIVLYVASPCLIMFPSRT